MFRLDVGEAGVERMDPRSLATEVGTTRANAGTRAGRASRCLGRFLHRRGGQLVAWAKRLRTVVRPKRRASKRRGETDA